MLCKILNILIIILGVGAILLAIVEIWPMEMLWRVLHVIAGIVLIAGGGLNLNRKAA